MQLQSQSKGLHNMNQKHNYAIAIIGALAIIIGALIAKSPEIKCQENQRTVPYSNIENGLLRANIILSEVNSVQVRSWLVDDLQYRVMSQTCLSLLKGKRIINPIPIDVIVSKYRISIGGFADSYFPAEKYRDINKLEMAIFATWKERHKDFPQNSFDDICVTID